MKGDAPLGPATLRRTAVAGIVRRGDAIDAADFNSAMRLEKIEPENNAFRFHEVSIGPDLFGGSALVRRSGRIGSPARQRIALFATAQDALRVANAFVRRKRAKGYRDVATP